MRFQQLATLDGRVAVIAGGTGAIGFAAARQLAALGCTCVLLSRNTSASVEALVASLPRARQAHASIRANVVDSASLRAAAARVADRAGRCDILVNSAGSTRVIPTADLEALDDDLIDAMMRVNFRGAIATIRAFLPLMRASGEALVANLSSIAAFTGIGSNLAYVAAKAGLDAAGESLARALAPEIRVVSVSPGVVESPFVPGRDDAFYEKASRSTPLRRNGSPEDAAAAIVALATSLRFVTGTRLVIDGGRHL